MKWMMVRKEMEIDDIELEKDYEKEQEINDMRTK